MSKMLYTPADEQALMTEIWDRNLADRPFQFVMFAFPWGKAGTPLENHEGPRRWQARVLKRLEAAIVENRQRTGIGLTPELFQQAVASGRGIGKSALLAWLTIWFMSTVIGGTVIVTANTEPQLKSRTWPELCKWVTMAINGHWFETSASAVRPAAWFRDAVERDLKIDTGYYYAQAQTWSEENPDAFAGAHNMAGIMVIFDEASGIPKPIWTVSEGFFTEPILHRYWFCFSNPRRNTGSFFECFHKNRAFWHREHIDAREVEGTDKAVYDKIIKQHGEDSDEARVEVKGQFPRRGDKQFIGGDIVEAAQRREILRDNGAPLMMGVDVARFGDDTSVIRFRQGRDARSIAPVRYKGLDTYQLARRVSELADKYEPDAICVDGGGVGGGVVDQLKAWGYRVIEVQFGARADDNLAWSNRRTEIWAAMRDWLPTGAIDDSHELADDLLGPEYDYRGDSSTVILESKEHMKDRGLASPDDGDALALTFAAKVARRDTRHRRKKGTLANGVDYSVLG
jgi:hypothetical protein